MHGVKQLLSVRILLFAATCLLACSCNPEHNKRNSLRIRWAHDPETVDPLQLTNQPSVDANNLLHVSLLLPEVATKKFAPALADSLPSVQLVGDSITRLNYRIRPLATWDTGRPVLATDVAFTLKLMFCPGLPNEATRSRYQFIQSVVPAPASPRSFTIVCRGQAVEYARTSGDFFVLSEAAVDPRGILRRYELAALQRWSPTSPPDSALQRLVRRYQEMVSGRSAQLLPGCGPYQLTKWEKDRYLTFRRKPRWWADELRPVAAVLQARPKQIEYVIIPDATTATLALQRGDLDVYPQVPAREFARLRASPAGHKSLRFYSSPSYDVVTVGFNTQRPYLADALTRRALSRCFDAGGLMRATQLGEGMRTVGIISPTDRTNYNDKLALLPFDLKGAAALLRQAGWQPGVAQTGAGWWRQAPGGPRQQLRLAVRYRADETLFATVALQFQAAAAQLQVPVTLQPTESVAFVTAAQKGDYDVSVRLLRGNPFMFNYRSLFHSQGADNSTGFRNAANDQLIEAITRAKSEPQRAELLRRFQALMQQETPIVPLFFLPNRVAADRQLIGVQITSIRPGYSLATAERVPKTSPVP